MNKKFLSAILFGALMVSSTGTFVSCKDYDDDIDRIDNTLNDLKSQIAALESKINEGKWITSVTSSADGVVITMSDGQTYNITNGKDGEAGAAGTEWTISEDGFWVCDGEKTTVKAVGQDATPEVKKENGKWYLWNGTEYEEFTGAVAPATNIPYYYADTQDPNNYVILVVCDKDGQNAKEIRLPLNEGLAQINVLNANFNVTYSIAKEGTNWPTWEGGSKDKPAKGEYMIGQTASSVLVQISPASYDLSGKTVKVVNTKGEELPIKLGKATPVTDARAASPVGLYEFPVESIVVNDEVVEEYADIQSLQASVVVNENVYSVFNNSFVFRLTEAENNRIYFGTYSINEEGNEIFSNTVKAKPGESVTIVPQRYQVGQLFDSYITMANTDQAKADSIRYGISFDGMTINFNDKAAGQVDFTVHYLNVFGKVYSYNIYVKFNEEESKPEEITSIVSKNHVATEVTKDTEQAFTADLKPYFDAMGNDQRLIWNDEYAGLAYYPEVKWVYEDPQTGKTMEKNINLLSNVVAVDSEGKTTSEAKKIAGVKVYFINNYNNRLNDFIELGGEFTAKVAVHATVKGSSNSKDIAILNLPFTIEKPSDATLKAAYTFNPSYNKDGVITVYGKTISNDQIFSTGTVNGYKSVKAEEGKIDIVEGTIKFIDNVTEYNKAYTLTGAKVTYAGAHFKIDDFKVMFANSKNFTTVMPAGISIISGSGNIVTVKYGKAADKNDKNIYYRVDNISGEMDAIKSVACEVEAKHASYLTATGSKDITLTAVTGDANKVSVATPVKVTLTITTSTDEVVKDTITVTLNPYPAQ